MQANLARSLAGGGGVVIGSYTGNDATSSTGAHATRNIELPVTPTAVMLFCPNANRSTKNGTPIILQGDTYTYVIPFADFSGGFQAKLDGNTLVVGGFRNSDGYFGFNANGVKYNYIAFT